MIIINFSYNKIQVYFYEQNNCPINSTVNYIF